jgi:hypothetical protein
MTRVLLVNHDVDVADEQTDALRRRGYEVVQCLGPAGGRCPILVGRPCDLAEHVDVLVYDAFATGEPDGARRLIEGLREIHSAVPIVLCATGIEPDWIETSGLHGVTPLVGASTGARLAASIEVAVHSDSPAAAFLR